MDYDFRGILGSRPDWLNDTDEDFHSSHQVVASGEGLWYDVTANWRARVDECNEPSGFVCEKSKYRQCVSVSIFLEHTFDALISKDKVSRLGMIFTTQ